MADALAAAFTDNLLTCSICLGEYEDPRVLPCYHTFCYGCICDHATQTVSRDWTFLCPLCREVIKFPREGLVKLKKDFRVQKAKELLRQRQQHEVPSPIKGADVHRVAQAIAQMISKCEKHPTNELKYYCEDDDTVVCGDCIPKEHYRHGIVPVELVANSNRKQIKLVLMKTERKLGMFTEAVAKDRTNELEEVQKEDTINKIKEQALSIQRLVEQRAQKLISEVTFACDNRKKQKDANKDTVELHLASLQSAYRFAQELITNGSDSDIMLHIKTLTERLTAMEKIPVPTPDTPAQISYRPGKISTAGLEAMLGEVRVQSKSPSTRQETNSQSAPQPPENEDVLEQVTMQYQPHRPQPKPSPLPPSLGTIQLNPNLPVFLEKAECDYSFNPKLKDDKINTFVTGLAVAEQLLFTVNGKESFIVKGNNRTKAFTHAGEFKFDIILNEPFDAAVSQTGHLYITSRGNKCVNVYFTTGQQLTTMGHGQLEDPCGITLNNQGHILVCDRRKKSIFTFHAVSRQLLNIIPISMCEYPLYITVNTVDDNIVISDWGRHCVHVLSPTGGQLYQYGTQGSGDGQLSRPHKVCTDSYGHIIIADYHNHRIVALSPQGQFIRYIVTRNDGLEHPAALSINSDGQLVVAEEMGEVKTFQYLKKQ